MLKRTNGLGGFTLAEVLITLGIIGVVAAMTMPTLINSTQGAQYKTAYKKALSVLSQAVVMNIALDDYDLSQTVKGTNTDTITGDDDDDDTTVGGVQSLYDLFKNRLNVVKVASPKDFQGDTQGDANYYRIVDVGNTNDKPADAHFAGTTSGGGTAKNAWYGVTNGSKWPNALTMLFLNDGIMFAFDNTQGGCAASTATVTTDAYCFGIIDVNGQKGPNRVVECDMNGANSTLTGTGDDATCTVSNPTDIYPVMFYDQTIAPATAAGRAVLYAK